MTGILETDKTLQNDLTDQDFLPVNRRRLNSITIYLFPLYINFQQQYSDLRMSSSSAYPPWRRLLLPTLAFLLFLTNHTWAFPYYQMNNHTVATRWMHDGWSLAFMKSINYDQTWRQKSHASMRCLLENDSKVWLQPWLSFFMFPKVDQLFWFSFTWNADKKP